MKRCSTCRRTLEVGEFNMRRASFDGLQNVCRECNRARARRYYRENRDAHLDVVMARRAAARLAAIEFVGQYLLAHPCVDCGERDVRVLDFDHRVGSEKAAEVMRLVQHGYSIPRVSVEIARCEVRCRNCHAKVTYDRLGENWRSALMRKVTGAEPDSGT